MENPVAIYIAGLLVFLSRPRKRIGFDGGEELHGFLHTFLHSVAGILDTAKRRHLDAITRLLPYVHSSHIEPLDESGHAVEVIGAYTG